MKYALLVFLLASVLSVPHAHAVPTAAAVTTISETAALLADISVADSAGNKVANPNGDVFLVLYNSDVTNTGNVVITPNLTSLNVPGLGPVTKAVMTVALTAGQRKIVGPFSKTMWNDSADYLQLTYTGTGAASLRISPLRLPR